jgi:hypothetical protein
MENIRMEVQLKFGVLETLSSIKEDDLLDPEHD